MAWLKIDDNAPGHRKLLRVPPAARWLWVCGLAYCQRLKTDGAIPAEALDLFGVKNPKPLADALVEAKLWHTGDDGFRVHDFLAWNDSAEQRETKSDAKGERQRLWREKKRSAPRLHVNTVDASTPDAADATPPPLPQPQPVQEPPKPPSGEGGRLTRAERTLAEQDLAAYVASQPRYVAPVHREPGREYAEPRRCPHEPQCDEREVCLTRFGLARRVRVAEALQLAGRTAS